MFSLILSSLALTITIINLILFSRLNKTLKDSFDTMQTFFEKDCYKDLL